MKPSKLIYPFFLGFITITWTMKLYNGFGGWLIGMLLVLIIITIKTIYELLEEGRQNDT